MTEYEAVPILYRRTDAPGLHYGVPNHDLTLEEFTALPAQLRRDVKASALFELVGAEQIPTFTLDPLKELTDEAYEALSPAEKGQRTREANRLADEAAKAQDAAAAAQGADDGSQDGE